MRMRRVGMILASAFAVACGGGDGGPTDPEPTPDFTMTVSPTSLQIVLGSGVPSVAAETTAAEESVPARAAAARSDMTFTVTINRTGGFTGAVTVTVEGLPTGVTASALVIGTGQTSGTVTLTTSESAAAGTSNPTVRGSASGITAKTTSLSLELVVPPGSGETFDIDVATGGVSVVQGNSTSATLDIDRSGGFTGDVSLTASSDPAGLGVSFGRRDSPARVGTPRR